MIFTVKGVICRLRKFRKTSIMELMKRFSLIIVALFLLVVFASPVSASAASKAGLKHASFFYFFDKAFEKADLFFTFNSEKKTEKALEYADERLAEAEESANENDLEAVAAAIENYQENVSLAKREARAIKDETKTENLLSIIASSISSHQEVLEKVLEKVPKEAKEAIQKAIEVSKKLQEEATKQVVELKGEIKKLKNEVTELNKKSSNLQVNKAEKSKANDGDEKIKQTDTTEENRKQKSMEEKIKQTEKETERKVEEEAIKKTEAEIQRQEEVQKQVELEQKITEEYEVQKRLEEEHIQQKNEQQIISQIKSDITYFTNKISSLGRDIEQMANNYRLSMNKEQVSYLSQTESYTSIYKPSITKRHREILNEASKGVWTDCTHLRDLWDYQSADYGQYSTSLNNAERTFNSNISFVANFYMPDFNFYLNQINQEQSIHIPTKEKLKQYLNQLNGLSISGVETFKNDISNLVSELNSLESRINDAKSYSISYQLPFSILIETDSLIREEKDWFAKTSCKNIPTN